MLEGVTAGCPNPQTACPGRALAGRKLASGFFGRCRPNRARRTHRKSLNSRRVARPAATKTASGVRYYGLRYYNPVEGRWLNRDPIEEYDCENLYAMCFNNPVVNFDFWGLFGDGQNAKRSAGGHYITRGPPKGFPTTVFVPYTQDDINNTPLGHSDFDNPYGFDFTRADNSLLTSPFTPWGIPIHFRTLAEANSAVDRAIEKCDRRAFEIAVHSLEDVSTHNEKGYRSFGGPGWIGHLKDGTKPDDNLGQNGEINGDLAAWNEANQRTMKANQKWGDKCEKCRIR